MGLVEVGISWLGQHSYIMIKIIIIINCTLDSNYTKKRIKTPQICFFFFVNPVSERNI